MAVESSVYTPKEEPAWPQILQSEFEDEIRQQHQRPHHHELQDGVRTARKKTTTRRVFSSDEHETDPYSSKQRHLTCGGASRAEAFKHTRLRNGCASLKPYNRAAASLEKKTRSVLLGRVAKEEQ